MIKNLAELFGVTKLSAFCPDGHTCAFTGHRPQNLPFRFNESDKRCIALKKQLRKLIVQLIEQHNVTHFISGMAIGVDMYAAEIVLDLKAKYPHITLESAIPCETQATKWSEPLRVNTPPETVPLDRTNGAPRPLKWCVVTASMVH